MRYSILILLVAFGCGAPSYAPGDFAGEKYAAPSASETAFESGAMTSSAPGDPGGGGPAGSLPEAGAVQRKIIYTATVDLVVEEFDPIPAKVRDLATQFEAYVARSNVSGSPGSPRSGEWTFRVPAGRYDAFLAAAQELGEVHQVTSNSDDVTEEFYDVEARIRNKKIEEARLVKLLEEATGKLQDVLAVEREIARVRDESERVEGRLRVLKDLTSLSTVTVSVREIKDYVPEDQVTYGTRVRRALDGSISTLVATAQAVSILLVVLLPWLGILLVLLIVLWIIWRILRGRRRYVNVEEVEADR